MPESGSSFQQSSFLGGEWSEFAAGRIDTPAYRTALNRSVNGSPIEEGAWERRSGRRRLGATSFNALGVVRTFWLPDHEPAVLEITFSDILQLSYLRFWVQQGTGTESDDLHLLCDGYIQFSNISTGTPAVVTIAGPPNVGMNGFNWSTGDVVQVLIDPSVPLANGPGWINRQFQIVKLTDTTYELYDAETGEAVDGSTTGMPISEYGFSYLAHVVRFALPYTSLDEVRRVRLVQSGVNAYLLSKLRKPLLLTNVIPASFNAISPSAVWFSLKEATFVDGPYLDGLPGSSQTGNSVAHVGPLDGSNKTNIKITDGSYYFQSIDVGRQIRVWCQPPAFQNGHTYTTGQRVTYKGNFWAVKAGAASSTSPSVDIANWFIEEDFGRWGYGTILAINVGGDAFSAQIQLSNPGGSGGGLDAATVTANANGASTTQIDTWQLGAYTTNQYPACGSFYEGRLFFAGAIGNRIDACMSDGGSVSSFLTIPSTQDPSFSPSGSSIQSNTTGTNIIEAFLGGSAWGTSQTSAGSLGDTPIPGATLDTDQIYFSPTNASGQVLDNSALALISNAPENDEVTFLQPANDGIVVGTISGEWVLTSGDSGGTIKPDAVVLRQVSKYGSAFVEAIRVGSALLFVQSYGRRVMEYVVDFFSRRFIGRHLNEFAKHLTTPGIIESAYQEESNPTLWCALQNGDLISCVYRRLSSFATEAPTFSAWSRYTLPFNFKVMSLSMAANQAGTLDQLVMLTTDGVIPNLNPIQPIPEIPVPPPPLVTPTPTPGCGPPGEPGDPGTPSPPGCSGSGTCVGSSGNADCGCGCGDGCGCGGCGCGGCGDGGCGGCGDGDAGGSGCGAAGGCGGSGDDGGV